MLTLGARYIVEDLYREGAPWNSVRSCVLETIASRASVRFFKPDSVPREVVEKLLEAGLRAPTAGGGEEWFFIVVESEEKKRRIHEFLKKAHMLYAEKVVRRPYSRAVLARWARRMDEGMYMAPLYIAAYVDLREPIYREEYRDFEKLLAHQSLAAALENIILAAWSMGLGSVWLGVPLLMRREFDEVLEPPPGLELAAILALGYPAAEPKPGPRRKTLSDIARFA